MPVERTTLAQFLLDQQQANSVVTDDLAGVIRDVADACATLAKHIARSTLHGPVTAHCGADDVTQRLGAIAEDIFSRLGASDGGLAGLLLPGAESPYATGAVPRGRYLMALNPLDGLSDIAINASVGSIFSILRAPAASTHLALSDFQQPGSAQVAAGYVLYGPSTMLVVTLGAGTHAFTLDPQDGAFVLSRRALQISGIADEFAVNIANNRFWEVAVKRYVEECLAGKTSVRARNFSMRWVASLVAETHRILMRGGVYLCPWHSGDFATTGPPRILDQANPVAFIVEQAGGLASTGRERILELMPRNLHQTVPLIFGATAEVELIESYYRLLGPADYDAPLFSARGLFRASA